MTKRNQTKSTQVPNPGRILMSTQSGAGTCGVCGKHIAAGIEYNYHIALGARHLECVGLKLAKPAPPPPRQPNALGPIDHPWAHDEDD